jgi:CRISPR-associated protein (TIGR02584 family)
LKTYNNNILICVSGLTPQIVTETLFCLAVKDKITINEIYVITTKRGREVILGKDAHPATPKTSLKTEIENLCKKYKIKKPLFQENDSHIIVAKEESIELSDIRSDKDNILFPNKVCSFIREKTIDPKNILHCSITGGRKSMSVHLANALALFAREDDRLVHVLTKEENEFKGFYPANKKEAKDLQLSQIPFVRLRSLLSHEIKGEKLIELNFDEIVSYTQAQLKIISDKNLLVCDFDKRELRYCLETISFEPLEFLIYYFFIDTKIKGTNKTPIAQILSNDFSNKLVTYLENYFPSYHIKDKNKYKWLTKGFQSSDFLAKKSKINKKIHDLITDQDIASQFTIETEKIYGESKYFIPASKERFKIIITS